MSSNKLAEAMRTSAAALEPPTGASLAAAGLKKGRRLRTARRLQVGGAFVAVLALGIGGALVLPGGGSAAVSGPAAGPKAADGLPPLDPGKSRPTSRSTLKTVLGLLPAGSTTSGYAGQDSTPPRPDWNGVYARFVLNDGVGGSHTSINVQPDRGDMSGKNDCARRAPVVSCESRILPDGSLLVLTVEPGSAKDGPSVHNTADQIRPDGLRVTMVSGNYADASKVPTRPEPALSLEQLAAIVSSPVWQVQVDTKDVEAAQSIEPYTIVPYSDETQREDQTGGPAVAKESKPPAAP